MRISESLLDREYQFNTDAEVEILSTGRDKGKGGRESFDFAQETQSALN
jgi:hypothetical protein